MTSSAAAAREDWRPERDRHDRQRRIAGWDQGRLERAHVFVAGAGAIGNEVLKLLALTGVGRVTVADMDRIDTSNLARMLLFREDDLGRPKAEVAARRMRELAPACRVEALVGDLEHDVGLGLLGEADVILGCVDNLHARVALNRAAQRLGIPWVNAAIDARALEVTAFVPDGPCFECGLDDGAWRRYRRRTSCGDGLLRAAAMGKVATVATLASLAAALQVEALYALLHGPGAPLFGLAPANRLYLSLSPLRLDRLELVRAPDCLAHERWPAPIVAPLAAASASFADLAAWLERREGGAAATSLDLGFDLVTALRCEACGREEAMLRPKGRLTRVEALCPACGGPRLVGSVAEVAREDALAHAPLARLGIPGRSILRIRSSAGGERFVEIGGGAPTTEPPTEHEEASIHAQ